MTVIPPISAVNVGNASGGGFLDTIKGALGGTPAAGATGAATAAGGVSQKPGDDGSVGLFDGIWKKALLGGAAGAGVGFILPFGGPIIGGLVGAVSGAAMGAFGNWRKMGAIKAENEATLAAMGVQTQDPQVQQILQSGQVSQLVPLAQQEMQAAVAQQTGQVGQATQQSPVPTQATQATGQVPVITDPSTDTTQQSPVPTQATAVQTGGGATNGASSASVMSVDQASATLPTTATAVPTTETAPTTETVPATQTATAEQLAAMIEQLQTQIDQLKAYLAEQDKVDQLAVAAAR